MSSRRAYFIANHVGDKLITAMQADGSARSTVDQLSQVDTLHMVFSYNLKDLDQLCSINLVALSLFEHADPTNNHQYLQWLVNKYIKKDFLFEDLSRVTEELAEFERLKPSIAQKDINRYKSIRDVYVVVQELAGIEQISNRQAHLIEEQQMFDRGDAHLFYYSDNLKVVIPKTEAASCYFGKGTRWCTAATKSRNHFESYNSRGPLYIVMSSHGKYQLQFPGPLCMNELDTSVPLSDLIRKMPEMKDAFNVVAVQWGYIPLVKHVTSAVILAAISQCDINGFAASENQRDHVSEILASVDPVLQTQEIADCASLRSALSLKYIRPEFQTERMASIAINQSTNIALKYIRPDLQQTAQFQQALAVARPTTFQQMNPKLQTEEIAHLVVLKAPLMLKYVRADLITSPMCLDAVKRQPQSLGHVPERFQYDVIIEAAMFKCPNDAVRQSVASMIHNNDVRTTWLTKLR